MSVMAVLQQHLFRNKVSPIRMRAQRRRQTVAYVRGALSGVAAIFVALLGPGLLAALRDVSNEKATGLAAIAGGLLESLLSPLFWIVAVSFFALFFAASRLSSKPLRILLFWTPALAISTLGFGLFVLFTYAWIHFKQG